MRNHLAVRAQHCQVRAREALRIRCLIVRFLCVLGIGFGASAPAQPQPANNAAKAPHSLSAPRARNIWVGESLQRYEGWKKLRDTAPAEARAVVEKNMETAQARPRTREERIARGFMAWRTLETVIDPERVERALAEYYRRFAGKRATAEDFLKICKEISGRDLRWFLDYYINGSELPRIALRRTQGNAATEISGQIVVENAPPQYQVRVEMRLFTATGHINHSVATNGGVTPFTVTSPQPVTRIALDPDMRILRRMR